MPATPPPMILTRDITSPRSDYARSDADSSSPTPSPRILHPSPEMLAIDTSFRTSLQRARRVSDVSMLSADMGHGFWRDSSPEIESHGDLLSSMQNSMWGDMMAQAAEEEDV
ncbi:hypothetical protein BV22DRAFT_1128787 [Leucogyrophana mollusca]|uniref:Uncharacterized protein n=1 Tax=Leucogyrophana mollusca TaxID=85980 RepID=A0ACB8BJU4_9AGAM|nr:hypothetical protein BV22DRAFT_1128787 [Leucogyrophana mollusca]